MKTTNLIIVTFVFVLTSAFSYSQTKNQIEIERLNKEIETAKIDSDYTKLNELNEKKKLHLEIEKALENDDFLKAQSLQNKLNGLKQDISTPLSEGGYFNHKSISPGFYVNFSVGYGFIKDYAIRDHGFNINFNFGQRFAPKKDLQARFGLDMNWINLNQSMYDINGILFLHQSFMATNIHFVSPGFYYGYAINEKSGFEASLNIGPGIGWTNNGNVFLSLGVRPRFEYRIGVFGVGIDIETTPLMDNPYSIDGWFFKIAPTISIKPK